MTLVGSKQGTTSYFLGYIKRRIKRNKNFLATITGSTGSGKSYSALRIAELLDPDFSIDRVCFTPREFLNQINRGNLKRGSVLIWDEAGVTLSSRQWQSIGNKLINYLLQTFRHRNYIVIFTAPHLAFLDAGSRKLLHCFMETLGINQEQQTVKLKPLMIQTSQRTGDAYFKYLRVIVPGQGVTPLKRYSAGMPSEELREAYERRKNEFTKSLNESIERDLAGIEDNTRALTPRQEEIVELLRQGLVLPEVGEALGISLQSVHEQLKLIRKKGLQIKPVKEQGRNKVKAYEVIENKL